MRIVKAIGVAVALLAPFPAAAAYLTLEDDNRGWYNDDGVHELYNTNYLAGGCTEDGCTSDFREHRNYFLFDLSGVSTRIRRATLVLWMPGGGFLSPTGSETYQLFDVQTNLDELGQRWGVDIFDDLGTGTSYAAYVAMEADEDTLMGIALNAAALSDLNAAATGFAFGGAVTSLDPENNDELLFAGSGRAHAYLVLETVPVPGATWLFASALLTLCRGRRCAGAAERIHR